ncbi:MAG: 1-(5-phosphoribosyl)-5-[(5-phosphoribosylamino)methylideneamino]imidazole-4-carboxamide isomerase [Dehalococcoidales bacterium]
MEKRGDTTIEIIPAVDIRDGRCVRLYQGDYAIETVFSDDPLDQALKWQSLGAPRLHIVDLDGAATGEIKNLEIIRSIAAGLLIPTQLGGGIRDIDTISEELKAGVERVILSTAAVENPELVREACRLYRESVIVSLDARDGNIAIHGWRTGTELNVLDFARSMIKLGVRRFIYTDINRDGTLTEPDFSAISELMEVVRVPVVAAGGVSSLNHIKVLQKLGAEAAIVGKAIYTGDIDLKNALAEMNKL